MATAESVKQKIRGLIDSSNTATGEAFADLSSAVAALIAGYGGGGNVLENLSGIHSWRKYDSSVVTEEDLTGVTLSYRNTTSTSDLSNYQWDTVSYADSIKVENGAITLVNPVSFVMSNESNNNVVKGKYVQGYTGNYYWIPEDASITYSKATYGGGEYINTSKAVKLTVGEHVFLGYVVSNDSEAYPASGDQGGFWYEYNGLVEAGGSDTLEELAELTLSDATAGFYMDNIGSGGTTDKGVYLRASVGDQGRAIINSGTTLTLRSPATNFGDATSADVVAGKTFTSKNGLMLTGTYDGASGGDASGATALDELTLENADAGFYFGDIGSGGTTDKGVYLRLTLGADSEKVLLGPGTVLTMRSPSANFGTATSADVAAGKTFTSASGLMLNGTHECSSGGGTSEVVYRDAVEVAAMSNLHVWKKTSLQTDVVTESEVTNATISYYNPSGSDLSNYQWDTVSYADSIQIVNGKITLVNPTTFTMSHDSDYNVVVGKYIQTGYNNEFYRIPEDAQMNYSKMEYGTSEYIRATKAFKLSVGASDGTFVGYAISTSRNTYPDDGEQDGYWYTYDGTMDEHYA